MTAMRVAKLSSVESGDVLDEGAQVEDDDEEDKQDRPHPHPEPRRHEVPVVVPNKTERRAHQ